jgi:hypothetical protein
VWWQLSSRARPHALQPLLLRVLIEAIRIVEDTRRAVAALDPVVQPAVAPQVEVLATMG